MEIIGTQAEVEDSRLVKQDYTYVVLLLFHPLPSVEPGLKKKDLLEKHELYFTAVQTNHIQDIFIKLTS